MKSIDTKIIYLIKSESIYGDISYKIGLTKKDPKKRLKQLQTGNHNVLEIVSIFESEFASILETSLHRNFEMKRVNGEWFELDDSDIESFLPLCSSIENNFKILAENNEYFKKHYL